MENHSFICYYLNVKKIFKIFSCFLIFTLFSCASTSIEKDNVSETTASDNDEKSTQNAKINRDTITLLFAGDIMAHSVNYKMSSYDKIWKDIKSVTENADLTFGNIEAPIDTTLPPSSFPNFNMPKQYVQSAINAGFDVFSLCNNHTNDQSLNGIKETIKTANLLTNENLQNKVNIYFSGLKDTPESAFSYNLIEQNGWKIIFLPITELLNRPSYSSYINYVTSDNESHQKLIELIKSLKEKNPCDLFILSIHTNETEYIRTVSDSREVFYKSLLEAGVDIIWANHAHIVKNRKVIINTETQRDQLIMYANGNTISGQRTKPDFSSKNPNGERDNTGDGLLYKITLRKNKNTGSLKLEKAEPIYITTYINTAYEYVIKPLNQDFVNYLYGVPRNDWAKYIERRIKINQDATKDLIEWQ